MTKPDQRKVEQAPFFASRRDGPADPKLRTIREAIREARILRLCYADADGTITDRRVRPLAIWAFTDGWLFAAWRELRSDFRAFRLDRISLIEFTGDQFADEPDKDLQEYLSFKLMAHRTHG